MATEEYDVIIVGTGPAGCSTALHLLAHDASLAPRIVMIDKAVHPREKVCGGGLSPTSVALLKKLGVPLDLPTFRCKAPRIVFGRASYSTSLDIDIIRRDELDAILVRECERRGVHVVQGEGVKEVSSLSHGIEVKTDKTHFRGKLVVAADGAGSVVRRKLGFQDGGSHLARLMEVLTPVDEATEPLFRDKALLADFTVLKEGIAGYYWDFPSYIAGKPVMNRGIFDNRMGSEKNPPGQERTPLSVALRRLLKGRGVELSQLEVKSQPLRCFHEGAPLSQPRCLLVGDAGGVDPLFGEGIGFALGYGIVASEVIREALQSNDFSFADYRRRFLRHPVGKNLVWRARAARFLGKNPWVVKSGVPGFLLRFSDKLLPARPLHG